MSKYDDPDDDPEVIRAEADAKARLLEARAKLHPLAQTIYALGDGVSDLISKMGCLLIIAIVVIAILAPQIINWLTTR